MMKKIILTQGFEYNDELSQSFSWPPQILIALLENNSSLLNFDKTVIEYELLEGYHCIPPQKTSNKYEIYYNKYEIDYAIKFQDKFYFYNSENYYERNQPEIISLLENNSSLCFDADNNIIFRIIKIPENLTFEIKRKELKIKDKWIEKEYIQEILINPRIYE